MVKFYLIFLAAVACASPIVSSSDIAKFESFVRQRDLDKAFPFAIFFENVRHPDVYPVLSQYYLMTCQPRRALETITKISPDKKREPYLAILYALVSAKRPSANQKDLQVKEKHKKNPSILYDLNGPANQEIWKDEWAELTRKKTCQEMPTPESNEDREYFRKLSKALFERLKPEFFEKDFGLVALAMDVGADLPDPNRLLQLYKDHSENPYYKRLQANNSTKEQSAVQISAIQKDTVLLEEFSIKKVEQKPKPIEIPIVFDLNKTNQALRAEEQKK
ncbi:MAG: hypothetical protein AB7F43_10140 [Bacteriovoracia bacterium]